jgi:stalled ribosome rescue protein Dom34
MHSTENRERAAYYKELSHVIRGYKEIILFGPGSAKTELFNLLKEDHIFHNIAVETEQTDKMTQDQMNTFVRKHWRGLAS